MPFLPPNQQRQSTEGTASRRYTGDITKQRKEKVDMKKQNRLQESLTQTKNSECVLVTKSKSSLKQESLENQDSKPKT